MQFPFSEAEFGVLDVVGEEQRPQKQKPRTQKHSEDDV